MHEQYSDKDSSSGYFENIKSNLLDLIPNNLKDGNLLEIGAAGGNTLIYAKKNGYAKNIYGIELCKLDNSNQDNKFINDFIIGNVEEIDIPYEENYFDVILCGDVLEHLIDPYSIVLNLKKYLKKDGVLIASIPNIRKISVLYTIFIKGDFKYEESGTLDRTHLRFFTKKNMIELFEHNGYSVVSIIAGDKCNTIKYLKQFRLFRLLKCFLAFVFAEFSTLQYHMVVKIK